MICGGVSVMGSYHNINQDWCNYFSDNNVSVIAVSDGVGSKKNSHIGADKICAVVIEEAKRCSMEEICSNNFLVGIQKKWQEQIGNADINSFCCTIMFCIVKEGKAFLAQFGDGIAGMYSDGEAVIFYDDNENHYINETDSLSDRIDTENWRTRCIPMPEKFGALLCTDGISVLPDDADGYSMFVKEFISEYYCWEKKDIISDVRKWLSEWKGNDDKTLAFMIG